MKRMQGHDAEKLLSRERKFLNAILRVKLKYMKDVSFSRNEMLFAMQKSDFHVLDLFCRASHVRASMHRITNLELLRTLMLCLVQLSKWRECKATDAEKLFLSERKLLNAILWIKLKYMKDVSFSLNVICNAEDRFSCVRPFCKASHIRASMHRINSLELPRTLMLVFSATKQMKRMQAHGCWKLLSQWVKVAKFNFKSKAQVHEGCFFLMKLNVICNAEVRFSYVRSFLQSKSCQSFHAQNH